MRPCPEFYGSDAWRTPAAAPQLLTRLWRTRVDQRARAARASRARLPECARERRQPPRALLLGATSASGAHAVCGWRGGTPCLRAKRERPIAALRFTSSSFAMARASGDGTTASWPKRWRRSRADRHAGATWLGWVHQPRLRASTSRYSKRSSVGPSGGPAFAFVANSRNSRSRFALRSGSSSTLANAATTGPKVRL
jgi:hypothetical protein